MYLKKVGGTHDDRRGTAAVLPSLAGTRQETFMRKKFMNIRSFAAMLGFAAAFVALPALGHAQEFYIGEPVVQNDMQIVPNYLVGIEMDRMPPGIEMGPDSIHLEADVHATKNEKHGF